jgi:hypothetical protein
MRKRDTKSHQLLVALPSEERVAWERFSLPDEVVVRWVNDNWKPADAAPWIRANASIEDARVWNPRHSPEIRFTYEAAQAWGAIGCDTSTAHHWAKRGFQPDQLVRFRATEQVMPEAPRGAIGWGAWRGCYIVADQQAIEVTTRRAATLRRMRHCTRWGELYSYFSPEAIEREFADVLDDCWLEHCYASMPWQEEPPTRPPDFRPSGPFFLNFARQARIHPLDLLAQAPTPLDLEPARKVPSRTTQNVWDLAEELCDIADISATNAYRLDDVQSAVDRMLQQR